jgi:hypothetical protein
MLAANSTLVSGSDNPHECLPLSACAFIPKTVQCRRDRENRRNSKVERFAFILHPLRQEDFTRKYPILKAVPFRWVEEIFKHVPPRVLSHITGIESRTGAQAEGWFIAVPMTPRVLLEPPLRRYCPKSCGQGAWRKRWARR